MIRRLDHVNILTPCFAETVAFYDRALGLVQVPAGSATMRAQNAWLAAADGVALIHVNGPAPGEPVPDAGTASRLNHFALSCEGLAAMRLRLDEAGVTWEERRIEARAITQINVRDPNGILVELTFVDP